jgi:hypothetical protein
MKEIVLTRSVKLALLTVDESFRRCVQSWFKRLANWDRDEFVRSHSHSLDSLSDGPDSLSGVHVLKTDSDLRIFFTIQEDSVTIVDIATKQTILAVGRVPEAE